MSKVAQYLQEHLSGEVMISPDARQYFSTDASIFSISPAIIVYPRNENDVRKTARFCWQLAERGRIIPLTARGSGTDQSGAALGNGIMVVFPAHMHRVIEFDGKTGVTSVEPGINFGKLQQTLLTHNRFLPPYPASLEYSTIGGAVANNAGGEKSIKYGTMRSFAKSLRAVLANGEVIETKRIGKRELQKKLGLSSMEGEVYRQLDKLIEENAELIKQSILPVTKNAAGYALAEVKRKDGSFDLTPLIVGSQGTLALVTEVTLETAAHNPASTLVVGFVDDVQVAQEIINELCKFSEMPATIEMIDDNLLNFVQQHNPTLLKGTIEPPFQKVTLFIEFDNSSDRIKKRLVKRATKLLKKYQINYLVEDSQEKKDELWKIREAAGSYLTHDLGSARAIPLIEDGIVPVDKLQEFLQAIYQMFKAYNLPTAVWGHAGNGNLHVQPMLDLGEVGDRQKIFKLLEDYYSLIMSLGGSTTAQHGDGRLRGPFLEKLYGAEVYGLFKQVKQIFDPYSILNPGVKIGVNLEDLRPILRQEYSLEHLYDHMPNS